MRPSTRIVPEKVVRRRNVVYGSAATESRTRCPGSSGPFPSECVYADHAGLRVSLLAVKASFSSGCQPGVRVVNSWSVFGSPPLRRVRHCTGQVATDLQSPEGGSQRASANWGCPPHGIWASMRSGVDEAVGPAWQLGSGLFGMPAREIRVNPLFVIGLWVVALQ